MEKVIKYINKEIYENETIVVACSGGPDSMCLLSLVCLLKNIKNYKIIVAHVNHKVRSESDAEALFVKNYCINNNLIYELKELNDFDSTKFSEELARKKRYKFFQELIIKYNAKYLLTAHHGDDLIETVLMRITRGSNLSGYAGIKKKMKNDNYFTLRPLLDVTKEDILKYNAIHNIEYVIDRSNESIKYTRNRYRNNILPFLKQEEINVHLKYLQYSKELEDYNIFVNNYIKEKGFIVDNYIIIHKIKDESQFIKKKTLELLIKNIQNKDELDVNNKNIVDLLKLIDSDNKSIDLNNGYKGIKEYDKLILKKNNNENNIFNYVLDKNLITDNFKILYIEENIDNSNNTIRLNTEELILPLIVRSRKNGDKIEIKNLNGTKKVKDIFIDEKLSIYLRDKIPIVTDSNNNIVWIPGVKKSKFAKDKSEKYDIILKYEVD